MGGFALGSRWLRRKKSKCYKLDGLERRHFVFYTLECFQLISSDTNGLEDDEIKCHWFGDIFHKTAIRW